MGRAVEHSYLKDGFEISRHFFNHNTEAEDLYRYECKRVCRFGYHVGEIVPI